MSEAQIFQWIVIAWFLLGLAGFIALFFVDAPYGRLSRGGFGPLLPKRLGWMLMESPSAIVFAVVFLYGPWTHTLTAWAFLLMWEFHYVYRGFIYPSQTRGRGKNMPVSVVLLGLSFNLVNPYLNARYLFHFSGGYENAWLLDPRFLIGAALFILGLYVNRQSDSILHNLRAPGETGYKIPYGGLFRYVSSPNYLGEIVQWIGWTIATWSIPGLAFAFWTAANLVPRAYTYHRWYRRHFDNYPSERAALIPRLPLHSGKEKAQPEDKRQEHPIQK